MSDPIVDIINTAYNRGLHTVALGAPDLAKQIRQQIGREIVDEFVRNPYKSVLVIVQEVCKMEES